MIHDDCSFSVVDFRVDASVADEIHDPFLAFGLGEAETGREVPG
jgi:hypothetical protein